MSTSEIQTLIAHLPVDVDSDLIRYGVSVVGLDVECIALHALDDDVAEVVSLDGCEVIELPVEVVSYGSYGHQLRQASVKMTFDFKLLN